MATTDFGPMPTFEDVLERPELRGRLTWRCKRGDQPACDLLREIEDAFTMLSAEAGS